MTISNGAAAGARSGGRMLVDALVANGVDLAFCVPGESYLAVLDALVDVPAIRLVTCRQEGGASAMAEAAGKLTGRPGICFVTRGPGATNASIGVHVARQDETPMLLFVGQVPRGQRGREAFQEVDLAATFAPLAKWTVEIDDATRIPEIVARAFAVATSGRPGPVVIALPEDMLSEPCSSSTTPVAATSAHLGVDPRSVEAVRALLADAQRPLVLAGGGRWSAATAADLARLGQRNALPVVVDFRCLDYVDQREDCYVGDTGFRLSDYIRRAIVESDVVLALGTRLGEIATGAYSVFNVPRPTQRLVHVYPDAAELGRVYQAELPIVADPCTFVAALAAMEPVDATPWRERSRELRAAFKNERRLRKEPATGVDLGAAVETMRDALPDDAIVTNGAGNFSAWLQGYFEFRRYGTQLAARNGSMGYGFPAAIAAKLVHPQRTVVAFVGDGDFLMSAQELATAMLVDARVIVIVVNNEMYGTIRMHQELAYPGRVSGTALRNPDFAAFARAFGAEAVTVDATPDFAPAFEAALRSGKTTLLEVRVDPNLIVPRATIAEVQMLARMSKASV